MLAYCYRGLRDRAEAEDAASAVFVAALRGLSSFRDRDDSFRAWLFRIAHNEVAMRHRHRSRHPEQALTAAMGGADPDRSPEEHAVRADGQRRLAAMLAELPPRERNVLELRLGDLATGEIARVLGITSKTCEPPNAARSPDSDWRWGSSALAGRGRLMAEGRLDERELDRFLNDVITGRSAAGGYDLDPEAMAAVRKVRELAAAPLPAPTRERLGPSVLKEIVRLAGDGAKEHPMHRTSVVVSHPYLVVPNRRASAHHWGARRRWAVAQFATAALLLLTLAAGYGALRLGPFGPADDHRGGIPAPFATSEATPSASAERDEAETLLAVTLPRSALPISPLVGPWVEFKHRVWIPGASAAYPAAGGEAGALLCVIAGTLGAVVDGEGAGVLRGADRTDPPAEEPLVANAAVALQRGDCRRHPLNTAVAVRNLGSEEVRVLETTMGFRPEPTGDASVATRFNTDIGVDVWAEAPGSRLAVRLDRQVLAPGETVPPPPVGAALIAAPEAAADTYALALTANGEFRNNVDRPLPVLVVTVAPVDGGAATPTD